MAGGDGERIRIQREDFDVAGALEGLKASSRSIGGIVVFIGAVRDVSQGEQVERLFFEYYPGMAEKQLSELRAEAIERFGLTDLCLQHRHGELLPGENIVLIIAASQHRAAAFRAAEWCIAELKKRVPIWKKEYLASGEVWVEGEGAT